MNLLFVADGNHQLVRNLAKWLKINSPDICIDIVSTTNLKNSHKEYYNKIYTIKEDSISKIINKIPYIRRYARYFYYNKILNKIDFKSYNLVHFHYIQNDIVYIASRIRRYFNIPFIFTIWGSDYYKTKRIHRNKLLKVYNMADIISFTNEITLNSFKNKYQWKKNNLHVARFGMAPLEYIKNLALSKEECKRELNWDPDKLAIVIGSNASPFQQHIKIIDQLSSQDMLLLKDKIQLIFPLTYGNFPKYKRKLLDKIATLPYKTVIYADYLDEQTIALIRKASDIMLNMQLTDQFSGAMQEHLYAKNIVITGSWLPYETLKNNNVFIIQIDEMKELIYNLLISIKNYRSLLKNCDKNSDIIYLLSAWNNSINKWNILYNTIAH